MLLFSTVLEINNTLTKDGFIKLVIDWNQTSPHPNNVIPGIKWNKEHNIRYGNDDLWLQIQEYRNGNTIAIRYEKTDGDGVIWDTDFIMNFTEMKMAIQLDRSYTDAAMTVAPRFSTPHFITSLADGGFLKNDGNLPTNLRPLYITLDNLDALAGVINGAQRYRLPVIYVSKNIDDSDPVDVRKLASRLKGAAHVLVQSKAWLNSRIRQMCDSRNEYNGAVGIYFQTPAGLHRRFLYRSYQGVDDFLTEKIVTTVINNAILQKIDPLYTWNGVNLALLTDRWSSRGEDLIKANQAMKDAEEAKVEAEQLVETTDDEIKGYQETIKRLTRENAKLGLEIAGLREKLNGLDSQPLLFYGDEAEFYPGEIKDIILSVLNKAGNTQSRTRRSDVLRDIVRHNNYQRLQENRAKEVKARMRGYKGMNGALKQFLEDYGFEIIQDGKHCRLIYYHDTRYHVTIPKTPSDHRGGENNAMTIIDITL